VQAQLLERIAHHQAEALGHVAAAGRGGEGSVGEGAVLEAPADDVVDVDHAGDGPGCPQADQQALGGDVIESPEIGLELRRGVAARDIQGWCRSALAAARPRNSPWSAAMSRRSVTRPGSPGRLAMNASTAA